MLSVNAWSQTEIDAPHLDPYLPGELNERALFVLQNGDKATALILLERAYVLNPNSPDIKANLEVVRKITQEDLKISVGGEVIHLDALGNPASRKIVTDIPNIWSE
jgi:hypothetical protein